MKSNNLFRNAGIVTAVLASLCCITPVLAVLGGISSIASSFSFLEPFRPYFITFTVIILGYAFYDAYKPKTKTETDCDCETEKKEGKKNFKNSGTSRSWRGKTFLWAAAGIALVLLAFPYYSKVLFPSSKNNLIANSTHIREVKLEIEGMSCVSCEQLVDYALKSEAGVLSATSSYESGTAYVQYDDTKIKPSLLKEIIKEKVGYKVKRHEILK